MRDGVAGCIALAAVLACDASKDRDSVSGGMVSQVPGDSLVLTTSSGTEIWYTLARSATGSDGERCVERGLEIRSGNRRTKVPLLYTGAPPVLVNDSTIRAVLWTHCQPGRTYLVSLQTGQPIPERQSTR